MFFFLFSLSRCYSSNFHSRLLSLAILIIGDNKIVELVDFYSSVLRDCNEGIRYFKWERVFTELCDHMPTATYGLPVPFWDLEAD